MFKKLKATNKGFTIIEVMIVLAIAAMILLIVLLAVPALQRNSRNTAIKNDASAIAGAISTYESDNDGKAVTTTTVTQDSGNPSNVNVGASPDAVAVAKVQAGTVVVGSDTAAPTKAITPGEIHVVAKQSCDGNSSTRAVSIWYSIETAGKPPTTAPFNNKCVDA